MVCVFVNVETDTTFSSDEVDCVVYIVLYESSGVRGRAGV